MKSPLGPGGPAGDLSRGIRFAQNAPERHSDPRDLPQRRHADDSRQREAVGGVCP